MILANYVILMYVIDIIACVCEIIMLRFVLTFHIFIHITTLNWPYYLGNCISYKSAKAFSHNYIIMEFLKVKTK